MFQSPLEIQPLRNAVKPIVIGDGLKEFQSPLEIQPLRNQDGQVSSVKTTLFQSPLEIQPLRNFAALVDRHASAP